MGDDHAQLEAIGSEALDRFITTFNSRDAAAWAASLSYPHVRVSPRAATETFSATEDDYRAAVNYDTADAMGWHHSEWDTKEILAVSATKIHAAAQWCRYDASGSRILPNNVSYVITNVGGRWGIQARFGVDSPAPDDPGAAAAKASTTFAEWWGALAGGAPEGIEAATRFPFSVVGTGAVARLGTPGELRAHLGAATAWSPSEVTALQIGRQGVNLGVRLTAAGGRTGHGLVLVCLDDAGGRVAGASLLPEAT